MFPGVLCDALSVPGVRASSRRQYRSPLRLLFGRAVGFNDDSFGTKKSAFGCVQKLTIARADSRLTLCLWIELALYVLPRALDSLAMILRDRGICTGFKYSEVALFSVSMSVIMYCYEVRTLLPHSIT